MSNWKHWIITGCLLLAAACATNPVTGKKELVLVSEAQEIEMGLANAQQVDQEMGLYEDPELAQYVSEIGMHRDWSMVTIRVKVSWMEIASSTRI